MIINYVRIRIKPQFVLNDTILLNINYVSNHYMFQIVNVTYLGLIKTSLGSKELE